MRSINKIVKELKEISNIIESDDIKERVNKAINDLNNIQDEIYEDLNSFDAYSEGRDEMVAILDELKEKVDPVQYDADNNWRNDKY